MAQNIGPITIIDHEPNKKATEWVSSLGKGKTEKYCKDNSIQWYTPSRAVWVWKKMAHSSEIYYFYRHYNDIYFLPYAELGTHIMFDVEYLVKTGFAAEPIEIKQAGMQVITGKAKEFAPTEEELLAYEEIFANWLNNKQLVQMAKKSKLDKAKKEAKIKEEEAKDDKLREEYYNQFCGVCGEYFLEHTVTNLGHVFHASSGSKRMWQKLKRKRQKEAKLREAQEQSHVFYDDGGD
jgi:hypothetical protein